MILSDLHCDRLKVLRSVEKQDEFGGTIETLEVIYEDIPCRLSQRNLRSTVISEINSSKNVYKVFTSLDVDIKQNDVLEVLRTADNSKYKFKAGKPIAYGLIQHKEILVEEIEENED